MYWQKISNLLHLNALPLVKLVRVAKIALAIIMLVLFSLTLRFVQQNVYKPITQAFIVAELKAKVALITIKRAELDAVLKMIEESKTMPNIDWTNAESPFSTQ